MGLALAGFTPAMPTSAMPPTPEKSGSDPLLLRVVNPGVDRMPRMEAAGYDVLELRDGQDFFVLGDDATAQRLRGDGYRVRVERTMAPPISTAGAGVEHDTFGTYSTFYGGYHTVAAHYQHLVDVAAAKPQLAKVVTFGRSWRKIHGSGGHDLQAICLTKQSAGTCAMSPKNARPRMLLLTAIHPRELPTAEMAWNWIDELADGYGRRAELTNLLNHTEVWVVPLANPDGREIVESGRSQPVLQRKNANSVEGRCASDPAGSGVDLNRNFVTRWGIGSDKDPCSELFRGPKAGSEPETQAIQALESALFPDQRGPKLTDAAPTNATGTILTYHNFFGAVLYPWDWTGKPAPNVRGLRTLAAGLSHFNKYPIGQAPDLLYPSGGDTDDDVYDRLGVPSLTVELGGEGKCADFLAPYRCVAELYRDERKGMLWYAQQAAAPYQAKPPA